MKLKAAILFLVKVVVAFICVAILWQQPTTWKSYHALLAKSYEYLLPIVDPSGLIRQVSLRKHDLVFDVTYVGIPMRFAVAGEIISGNTFLLIPLFLASPIRRYWRAYLGFFIFGLAALFTLHLFTISCFAQNGLRRIPDVMDSTGPVTLWFLKNYLHYSFAGLYVLILATWCPYVLYLFTHTRGPLSRREKRESPSCTPTR